ncbi:hypothetical protein ACTU3I_03880 [Microbacterium sp. RD1]|uniref:hypothetical protein n=1 Tax=Microbacterium sp. RD1 TaxID=3457313 RepID=UPI003FA5595A
MREVLTTIGRLLLAHWPALVAWFLAGALARYLAIELAGFVGAYTAIGGFLLLPLAALSRLIGFVAMFLVLRDGMRRLGAIAPLPVDGASRRRAFRDALLSAILPFFAVYAAWGFLRQDVQAYTARALEVQTDRLWVGAAAGVEIDTSGTVDKLGFEPWTLAVIAVAFAGRWAWKRWSARLPKWLSLGAVYLEAVWVFLSLYVISEAIGQITGWVDSRQAMVWLADLRGWLADAAAPIAWVWSAVEWLLGELGGIILLPLAWLAIAGVIYGQAVEPQQVRIRAAALDRVRGRYGSLPARLRRRLSDIGAGMGARFRPIWRAIVLMWRGGPILIGGYVLLYTVLILGERMLGIAITRLVGPHDLASFWMVADTLVFLAVPLIIEPVRTVLVASAYDATVGALIGAPVVPSGHVHDESQEARQLVADSDVDTEGPGQIVGDEEGRGHDIAPGEVGRA